MLKTATFAVTHFSVAFLIVFLLTGDAALGGVVGVVEPAFNTVAYHFHERIWEKIRRRRQQESYVPSGFQPVLQR